MKIPEVTKNGVPRVVASTLAAAARRGVQLKAEGDQLRYWPRAAMTVELARIIKANRQALLAFLSDKTHMPDPAFFSDDAEAKVLSVLSVSEQAGTRWGVWGESELKMLARAGHSPDRLPLVSAVKGAFADWSVTVVSIEQDHGPGGWTRRQVGDLIRQARRHNMDEAVALRDAWNERMAICIIDGGLLEPEAEQIALDELQNVLHF